MPLCGGFETMLAMRLYFAAFGPLSTECRFALVFP